MATQTRKAKTARPEKETVLFTRREIQRMVNRVARQIHAAHDPRKTIVLILLLKGGMFFGVDLARALEKLRPGKIYIEEIRVSSYGKGRTSSGNVRILMDIERSIHGRNAIVVDDVADTCNTIAEIAARLLRHGPRKLQFCVAVDKVCAKRCPDVKLDFVGFREVEGFLVGNGLDLKGTHRGDERILRRS